MTAFQAGLKLSPISRNGYWPKEAVALWFSNKLLSIIYEEPKLGLAKLILIGDITSFCALWA